MFHLHGFRCPLRNTCQISLRPSPTPPCTTHGYLCAQDHLAYVLEGLCVKAVGNGKRNGTGSWATEEDNVNFKWEIRGEEVLFHTKSGGVIVGEIGREAIGFICPAWGFILSRRPGDDL